MDFVTRRLDGKIRISESRGLKKDIIELYRIKVEYGLFLILGSLWNKYYVYLSSDQKELVLKKIRKPSIGSVIECISILDDKSGEILKDRKSLDKMQLYTKLRNSRIGHGYVIGEAEDEVLSQIKEICGSIYQSLPFLSSEKSLIFVDTYEKRRASGIIINPDGQVYPWSKNEADLRFEKDSVLIRLDGNYYRLDPFIVIEGEDEAFLFKDIADLLSGSATLNGIFSGEIKIYQSEEFRNPIIHIDNYRAMRPSGTVSNKYDNNYVKYININVIKNKIAKFIEKDRASVTGTVWGHGGVGKTAIVQSICDDIYHSHTKKFDYVIFASAKNVVYDYNTGKVSTISHTISNFESLIDIIGKVLFPDDVYDTELILDAQTKMLLVIDDFETLSNSEKSKISAFIAKMDIDRHKVIITTRANATIGVEFPTNELSKEDTGRFIRETIRGDLSEKPILMESFLSRINDEAVENIFAITSGRPLFILQFYALWSELGDLREVFRISTNIQRSSEAMQFLYGRIYEYLSDSAKRLFVAMGALIDGSDETNLISKVQYALDIDDQTLESALSELIKLKMVETPDSKFFRAYSKEIAQMMTSEFNKTQGRFKDDLVGRISIATKDKLTDLHTALLENANASRNIESETNVVNNYLSIVNDYKADDRIKLLALNNLVEYLFNTRGKRNEALNALKANYDKLKHDPDFVRLIADYCTRLGDRKMSVYYINSFIKDKPSPCWGNEEVRLEMQGLALMYKGIMDLEERQSIYNNPNSSEADRIASSAKMKSIIALGNSYFDQVKQCKTLDNMSARAKQNILAGFSQCVIACMRMHRLDESSEICLFAIRSFPTPMTREFGQKLREIERRKKTKKPIRV